MALFEQAVDVVLIGIEFAGFQTLLEVVENEVRAAAFDLLDGRNPLALDDRAGVALDRLETIDFTAVNKAHRTARAAGAAGAADAVDVVFRVGRQVVVEDDVDFLDVESAGCDVGGDEDFHGTVAEALENAFAHLLGDVAVKAVGGVAPVDEVFSAFIDRALGVAENNPETGRVHVENAGKHLDFGALAHFEIGLLDRGNGAGFLLDLDDFRAVAEFLDQAGHARIHRRGEEQRLAVGGKRGEQLVHFVLEAHVEHSVGLVEDGHLNAGGVETAAAEVVEQAAGSADDELRAGAQRAELAVDRGTAVNRSGVKTVHFCAEAVDFLADLDRELAGGAEDQHLRVALFDVEFRKGGKRESGGFPGAGGGKADQVLAQQGRGDAHGLNRRGTLVTEGFNGGEQSIGQPEFGKRRRIHEQM